MQPEHERRFSALQDPWLPPPVFEDFFGLDVGHEGLVHGFQNWAQRIDRRGEVYRHGEVHRFAFERYLNFCHMLPIKWASAKLGMTAASLRETLLAIQLEGLLHARGFPPTSNLVDAFTIQRFHTFFPGFEKWDMLGHNRFCRELHHAVNELYKVRVEPLFCATSRHLKESPPAYAEVLDAITDQPVGLEYRVQLNFGKPPEMPLDVCSLLFFAREKEKLTPFVFESDPEFSPFALLAGLNL